MARPTSTVPLVLLGCGGVGRALLRQIVDQRAHHAAHHGLRLAVAGVADSTAAVVAPEKGELSDSTLAKVEDVKAQGGSLSALPWAKPAPEEDWWMEYELGPGVLVDCTASEDIAGWLQVSLDDGWHVALANKLPLVGDWAGYADIAWRGDADHPRLHEQGYPSLGQYWDGPRGRAMWEATVGSGLPVIAALERLVDAGDTVRRIAGTFSGTMNFLTNGLREGRRYSELVHEARARHYTEPDPRTDLGGVDMARKALILARGCGLRIDLDAVEVEALYPPHLDTLDIEGFMGALEPLDEDFEARVAAARAEGGVLRYLAEIDLEAQSCRVGPTVVPADSPLGLLRGTDNLVTIHSRWYDPTPLVLQGRGAGVDATAAGVLADVVQLAGRMA